ncbi:MAG: hypothetical protein AAFU85_03620 [Planctomycetota bacterium]
MNAPRKEPLLPQIPLLGLIGLVTLSALILGVFHQAATAQQVWAVLGSIAIAATLLPILLYMATFGVAMVFSEIGAAAVSPEEPPRVHVPTAEMRDQT